MHIFLYEPCASCKLSCLILLVLLKYSISTKPELSRLCSGELGQEKGHKSHYLLKYFVSWYLLEAQDKFWKYVQWTRKISSNQILKLLDENKLNSIPSLFYLIRKKFPIKRFEKFVGWLVGPSTPWTIEDNWQGSSSSKAINVQSHQTPLPT